MNPLRRIAPSHRVALVAVTVSAALHAAALMGIRSPESAEVSLEAPAYSAKLETAMIAGPPPAPVVAPARKPRPRKAATEPRPGETLAFLPAVETEGALELPLEETSAPEMLALAQPPMVSVSKPVLPDFRPEALPGEITISYALSSIFADGEAEYTWKRDGDRYEIAGTAQAIGFFTLFLEGRIEQSASGRVTPEGLRPERFTERRGSTPEEGLTFDWDERQVQFRRGDNVRTGPLTDSTVDWLSMIFQLAHHPPKGESMELRVYTQRRLYQYSLQVMGTEELDLPFGRARTLHLRHTGDRPEETVDVWLGIDQHYVPVKLRYPVARNRLVVEQTATSVRAR